MSRRLLALLAATALTFGAAGCQHAPSGVHPINMSMSTSSEVPAANGSFEIRDTGNGSSTVHVVVCNLTSSKKMCVGPMTYVVWIRGLAADARAQNFGALSLDGDLNGTLDGVTPLERFEVFVTSEPSAAATEPTGRKLLWGVRD